MTNKTPYYRLLDHTADLGMEVRGIDLKDLFTNAGKAFMHLMLKVESPSKGDGLKGDCLKGDGLKGDGLKGDARRMDIAGTDLADLMVRWLGELLYLFEGEDLVATIMDIDVLTPRGLGATLRTIPFDPSRHEIIREIKAVTYHQIAVIQSGHLWKARVIFDL